MTYLLCILHSSFFIHTLTSCALYTMGVKGLTSFAESHLKAHRKRVNFTEQVAKDKDTPSTLVIDGNAFVYW